MNLKQLFCLHSYSHDATCYEWSISTSYNPVLNVLNMYRCNKCGKIKSECIGSFNAVSYDVDNILPKLIKKGIISKIDYLMRKITC